MVKRCLHDRINKYLTIHCSKDKTLTKNFLASIICRNSELRHMFCVEEENALHYLCFTMINHIYFQRFMRCHQKIYQIGRGNLPSYEGEVIKTSS